MNELSSGWKLFRVISILYFVLIAFLLVRSIIGLMDSDGWAWHLPEIFFYSAIFWFLFLGHTLLNENFPDTPLSFSQKRKFNWLFLWSVLAIPFLSGVAISEWKLAIPLVRKYVMKWLTYLTADPMPAVMAVVLLLHLAFLGGMYQLRTSIFRQSMRKLHEPFTRNQ